MEHNPPLRAGLEIVAAPGGSAAWLVDGTHVLSRAYGSRVLHLHLPLLLSSPYSVADLADESDAWESRLRTQSLTLCGSVDAWSGTCDTADAITLDVDSRNAKAFICAVTTPDTNASFAATP